MNDDTFVAAYLDLAALPKTEVSENHKLFAMLPHVGEEVQSWFLTLKGIGGTIERLRAAGVDIVFLVAGLGDVSTRGGPLMIIHIGGAGQPANVARLLTDLHRDLSSESATMPLTNWLRSAQVRVHGIEAVLVGAPATLDRYTSLAKSSRADLTGPLDKLASEGAVVASVFCPGPDFRRVVRELWPALPGPLAPLKSELADKWQHLELAANVPPGSNSRLALQAADPEAAQTFVKLVSDLPLAFEAFGPVNQQRNELKGQLDRVLAALPPQQESARVTIKLPVDESASESFHNVLSEALNSALESSRRQRRINQFKQLVLGILNYEAANRRLPSAAIRDAQGRPLLSWRVAVLPFMDDSELYRQFHLDEPWDSPHNRRFIEKMPAIFADPDSRLQHLAREGKTTFQVPVGPETIFYNNEGALVLDVKDGISHTMMLVEVEPQRAVIWTKPEDWEVDMQNPRLGVERTDRPYFTAGFADAHVSLVPVKEDLKTLRAILTRAGGEQVEQPPY